MEFDASCPYNNICIQNIFKYFYGGPARGHTNTSASAGIVLNASDIFVDLLTDQFFGFFFSLVAVEPKGKDNSYILILCASQTKFFKQRWKDLCSWGWPGNIAYYNCNS